MKKIIISILFISVLTITARATDDMRRLLSQPDSTLEQIFLDQPVNTRLDMLDYYDAKSRTFTADHVFGTSISIDTLSDRHVRIATQANTMSVDFYLLTPANDSIIVKVVNTPVGNNDAILSVTDLRRLTDLGSIEPAYSDWLVKDALKTVSGNTLFAAVPFVSSTVDVDTENNRIVLVNTAVTVPGLDETVKAAFLPAVSYKWNGKKFVREK